MPSIRDRLARAIAPAYDAELTDLRGKLRELSNKAFAWDAAYERMPHVFSRADYSERLHELSTDAYNWLKSMEDWESVSSFGSLSSTGEAERRQAVEISRFGYRWLILCERMTRQWTDFAFSAKPTVMIDDEKAQEDWNRFWQSDANLGVLSQARLPQLSDQILVDGELFPVFFIARTGSKAGEVTMRVVACDQIDTIVRPPGDDAGTLGYIRSSVNSGGVQTVRTYRDWAAGQRDLERAITKANLVPGVWAEREATGSDVVMQHVWFTGLEHRGWPAFHKAVPWARAYQNFMSWRLTLARSVATFWEDLETTGGSRDVKNITSVLQSAYALGGDSETNPAAPVGSIFAHNAAVKRQRMPLGTGAGDAEIDGMTVLSYAGLAAGIPPHWLGRPDMMQNRATARELLLPVMRQWERYQSMWEDTIREWARIVLKAAQTYPTEQRARYGKPIEELTIEVNMPTALSSAEFPELIAALTGLAQAGILRQQEVAKIALGLPELGIQDPDEIYGVMFPETSAGGAGEEGTAPESVPAAGGPVDADQTLNPEEEQAPEQAAEMQESPRMSEAAERAIVEAAIRRIMDGPSD
jgi:hypothetical protein